MLLLFAITFGLICTGFSQFSYTTPEEREKVIKNYYPAAPLHYVKIGKNLDGDYKFGYDTGKGPLGQSFREEIRLADGTITGAYGLIDEMGQKRIVRYSAGKGGFIAEEDKYSNTTRKPTPIRAEQETRKTLNHNSHQLIDQTTTFQPNNYLASKLVKPLNRLSMPVKSSILQNLPTYSKNTFPHRDVSVTSLLVNNTTLKQNALTQSPVESFKSPKPFSSKNDRLYLLKKYVVPNNNFEKNLTSSSAEAYKSSKPVRQDKSSNSGKNSNISMISDLDKHIQSSIESYRSNFDVHKPKPGDFKNSRFIPLSLERLTPTSINPYKAFWNEQYHKFLEKSDEHSLKKSREENNFHAQEQDISHFNTQSSKQSLEDEYYENTPVFIDEERLSYSIGTGNVAQEY